MHVIEKPKMNILVSDRRGHYADISGAGDFSGITEEENALLASAVLAGKVVKAGPFFELKMLDFTYGPPGTPIEVHTVSPRIIVDALKRGD